MLFNRDYVTYKGITIREPRVGEIVDLGEEDFYRNLNIWVTNPTSYRVSLWNLDPRVDWCKITDFELFCSLYKAIDPVINSVIFPNADFSTFDQKFRQIGEDEYEPVLYSEALDMVLDSRDYLEISQYLRVMFGIFPKDEYAKGTVTKEALIWEDEQKMEKNKDKGFKSTLFPLISFLTNHPGFKYRTDELDNIGIFQIMDSATRIPATENTRALLVGSMSGFCDTSKVDKENFNFMRDCYVHKEQEFTEQQKEKFKSIQVYGS